MKKEMEEVNGYQIIEEIGMGNFTIVYKAKKDDKFYALKKFFLSTIDERKDKQIKAAENELTLKNLNCRYIIKFFEDFIEDNNMYFITEYCDGGDLSEYILKARGKKIITDEFRWKTFIKICIGISYIHSLNIIHRDIKPGNIFLDSSTGIKIGDFGFSRTDFTSCQQSKLGTQNYIAPEIIKKEGYGKPSDIWCLGCILYELWCLVPAFQGEDFEVIPNIIRGKYSTIPKGVPKDVKKLIAELLNVDKDKRPIIQEILKKDIIIKKAKEYGLQKELEDYSLQGLCKKCYDEIDDEKKKKFAEVKKVVEKFEFITVVNLLVNACFDYDARGVLKAIDIMKRDGITEKVDDAVNSVNFFYDFWKEVQAGKVTNEYAKLNEELIRGCLVTVLTLDKCSNCLEEYVSYITPDSFMLQISK